MYGNAEQSKMMKVDCAAQVAKEVIALQSDMNDAVSYDIEGERELSLLE